MGAIAVAAGADIDWFTELYRASYTEIVITVCGLTRDLHAAEEATQEAFARGFDKRRTLRSVDNRAAWLTTVAINEAKRKLRRGKLFRRESMTNQDAAGEGADVHIDRIDLWREVLKLPADQRQTLMMFHFADLPMTEIADRLGIALGTVKSRLARARATLADRLAYPLDTDPVFE